MKKELIVKNSIVIHASPEIVWDVLTNPAQTRKYMFGCETVSEWKKGSTLLWKGHYEGKDMVFVSGVIVDIKPNAFLAYTTFDPNVGMEDTPANHVTVTYKLIADNGKTILNVTQGDFANVADGEKRFKDASNNGEGWNPILIEIKKVVEAMSLS